MPNPNRSQFAIFALACTLAWLLAAVPGARADRAQGSLQISFTATSTLHDFEGTAKPIPISIEAQPNGTWAADVFVPVAELNTGIDRRDANLRAMLDVAHHPQIRGRFRDVAPEQVHKDEVLPFLLRIREVERPVQATISHWQQDERQVSLDAEFDVSLAAFALEAPSVLFVSVGDVVHVTVHVTLERS